MRFQKNLLRKGKEGYSIHIFLWQLEPNHRIGSLKAALWSREHSAYSESSWQANHKWSQQKYTYPSHFHYITWCNKPRICHQGYLQYTRLSNIMILATIAMQMTHHYNGLSNQTLVTPLMTKIAKCLPDLHKCMSCNWLKLNPNKMEVLAIWGQKLKSK